MSPCWTVQREVVRAEFSERLVIARGDRRLTFADVFAGWRTNEGLRTLFCTTIVAAPYPAFLWEMPPIRRGHTDAPYECMLIRSDALARMAPDSDAFESQFGKGDAEVATFPNLGRDAVLVAPRIIGPPENYAHLAAFMRAAPATQQHALLRALGNASEEFLYNYDRRIWISTSGLGIAWLHIRLDIRPKYYQHQPYTRM